MDESAPDGQDPMASGVNTLACNGNMSDEVEKIRVHTNDQQYFDMDIRVARMSEKIDRLVKENVGTLHLDVNITMLGKVEEFAKKHLHDPTLTEQKPSSDDEMWMELDEKGDNRYQSEKRTLDPWDADFLDMESDLLFKITDVCFELKIRVLMDLCARKIASVLHGKSVEEMKSFLYSEIPSNVALEDPKINLANGGQRSATTDDQKKCLKVRAENALPEMLTGLTKGGEKNFRS